MLLFMLFFFFPPQDDSTPLHIAAEKGHLDVVIVLLSYNADGTIKDKVPYLVLCAGCTCMQYMH